MRICIVFLLVLPTQRMQGVPSAEDLTFVRLRNVAAVTGNFIYFTAKRGL